MYVIQRLITGIKELIQVYTPCADSCRLQVAFPDPFHHPPPVGNDYLFHLNETAARAGFSAERDRV